MNRRNMHDWKAFVRRNEKTYGKAHGGYHSVEVYATLDGWSWVNVGHNASCHFYVGHNKDYTQFAIRSLGEGDWPEGTPMEVKAYGCPPIEEDVYRHSSTLTETLRGAYLGHF